MNTGKDQAETLHIVVHEIKIKIMSGLKQFRLN